MLTEQLPAGRLDLGLRARSIRCAQPVVSRIIVQALLKGTVHLMQSAFGSFDSTLGVGVLCQFAASDPADGFLAYDAVLF